jgi:hypothetical protein
VNIYNIYSILHHLTATGVVFTACGGRLNGALVKCCGRGIHFAQVVSGYEIKTQVSIMDVAPAVLRFLWLEPPAVEWGSLFSL